MPLARNRGWLQLSSGCALLAVQSPRRRRKAPISASTWATRHAKMPCKSASNKVPTPPHTPFIARLALSALMLDLVDLLWLCADRQLVVVERTLKPGRLLPARQDFLCRTDVCCLALTLLAASTTFGVDLYLQGASLPWVAAWWLIPSVLVFALMGRALRALGGPGSLTVPALAVPLGTAPSRDEAATFEEPFYAFPSPRPPPR